MRQVRILIVDDREINRYVRGEILQKAGYEIIEAWTGRQALQRCIADSPDMVLLDIGLPDITGFEVCRQIKKDPRTAPIMIIQISASSVELSDAVTGLEAGADGYLMEPVEPALLIAKVRSLLRLRTVEEYLRRSNDDLRQFAYVASHDLQEPLRMITSFAQLLDRDYRQRLDDQGVMYLDTIIAGSQRMSALITDLLEYATVSASSTEEPAPVSIEDIVAEVKEIFKAQLEEAKGAVTCDPLPVIEGSRIRLVQLFRNLLENAIKYRRPDVPLHIHVSADDVGRAWRLSVKDNGEGFDSSFAEEIFGIFRRLHGHEVTGTGIGLAICRTVVERAGGRIWAQSELGQGSTFYFTWPHGNEGNSAD